MYANYYSNCCNAFMDDFHEEISICPECGEHCGMEKESDINQGNEDQGDWIHDPDMGAQG